MRRMLRWALALALPLCMFVQASALRAATVYVAAIEGEINGGTAEFLSNALARAEAEEASVLVIELDTPGGSVGATKDMVSDIMNAKLPVVVFVSPRGAWAASAGTFITMSGHVAAMAPGTTIGAAHPVGPGGQDPGGPMPVPPPGGPQRDDPAQPAYRENFIGQKLENMIAAFAESIARERGRNVEFAAQAVRESIAITDGEAVEKNVVDLVAQDLDDLLEAIHGREVRVGKQTVTLDTRQAEVVRIEMTWQEQLLSVLASPLIAFGLLMLGLAGIYIEVTNPGGLLPGVAGLLCLVRAAFAFQIVPFNPLGIGLILVGIVLMAAEAFVPAFGALFVIGACMLAAGGYVIFDVPELEGIAPPFWSTIFPSLVVLIAFGGFLVFSVSRSLFLPAFAGSGAEGLVGQIATVDTAIAPRGRIKLQGELWNAESDEPLLTGERVRIDAVHDLVVRVSRVSKGEGEQ